LAQAFTDIAGQADGHGMGHVRSPDAASFSFDGTTLLMNSGTQGRTE
jgi:hypothetical protein